jgi:hypothetical protein
MGVVEMRTQICAPRLESVALATVLAAFSGCVTGSADSTAAGGLASVTDVVAEFLRSGLVAWVL